MKFSRTTLAVFGLALASLALTTAGTNIARNLDVGQVAANITAADNAQIKLICPSFTDKGVCAGDEITVLPFYLSDRVCGEMCACVSEGLKCGSYGFCDANDVFKTCTAHSCTCVAIPADSDDNTEMTNSKQSCPLY